MDPKEVACIKSARAVVEREFKCPMDKMEEDNFKVAFVVFAMSLLLAPSAKHDYSRTEYWPALAVPDEIGEYDWSSYVVYRVLLGAAKLKRDMNNKKVSPSISGCILFLHIDLGILNLAHSSFPRCKLFTPDRLKAMAAADALQSSHDVLANEIQSTLRHPSEVCYTWAKINSRDNSTSAFHTRLFSAAMELVAARRFAAFPIFFAMMQRRRDINSHIDEEEVHFFEVVSVIAKSYQAGFQYSSPARRAKRPCEIAMDTPMPDTTRHRHVAFSPFVQMRGLDGSNSTGRVDCQGNGKSVVSRADCKWEYYTPGPGSSSASSSVKSPATANKVMSEFYLWSRRCKSLATIHSRAREADFDDTHSPVVKKKVYKQPMAPSPWEMGEVYEAACPEALEFYKWMLTLQPPPAITAPWILHMKPKFLEMALYDIHQQITARADFDMDFMDLCIRRIAQLDDCLYGKHRRSRWRHLMESDFMASLLAGKGVSSQLMFFPALVNQRWVCYVWNLDENEVSVYDPLLLDEDGCGSVSLHSSIVARLHSAMQLCADYFFDGWTFTCEEPRIDMLHTFCDPPPKNRTGVYCAHFCKYFDGEKPIVELSNTRCDRRLHSSYSTLCN
ncbi:hypothetical protein ACP70R_011934 [Stipagrostis hirtigluma subsp. patula]